MEHDAGEEQEVLPKFGIICHVKHESWQFTFSLVEWFQVSGWRRE